MAKKIVAAVQQIGEADVVTHLQDDGMKNEARQRFWMFGLGGVGTPCKRGAPLRAGG